MSLGRFSIWSLLFLLFAGIISGCGDSSSTPKVEYTGQWLGYGRVTNAVDSPSHWMIINFPSSAKSGNSGQKDTQTNTFFFKKPTGSVSGVASVDTTNDTAIINFTDSTTNDSYTVTISPDPSSSSSFIGKWINNTTKAGGELDFLPHNIRPSFDVNDNLLTYQAGTGTPVIFIHGMTGKASNWVNWLQWLQQNSTFLSRHSVYFYQYDWQQGIDVNGNILVQKVSALNFTTPPILIGHSMGTLVSRSYIAQGGRFARLVELAGPNNGSPLATDFWLTLMNLPGQGPRDLNPNSAFIKNLNTNATDIASRANYYTWGGEMKGHFTLLGKWVWDGDYNDLLKLGNLVIRLETLDEANDGLVPKSSAFLDGTNKQPIQNCDHFQFLNPTIVPQVASFIGGL